MCPASSKLENQAKYQLNGAACDQLITFHQSLKSFAKEIQLNPFRILSATLHTGNRVI